MSVPWWAWLIVLAWCLPGAYCFVALLRMKPIKYLPEEGEESRPAWRLPKVIGYPVGLLLLLALGPFLLWSEYRAARKRPPFA
jgi:hypothetical protein